MDYGSRDRWYGRVLSGATMAALSAAIAMLGYAGLAVGLGRGGDAWEKGFILVQPRAGLPNHEFEKALLQHGGKSIGQIGSLGIHVVQLPQGASEKAVAQALSRHPHMKFAEVDRLVAPDFNANDTYFGSEWHLQMIQAPAAWDISMGDGVTVAILDTGVDGTHPDLQGKLVPGWNFYDNNNNTTDVYGHGTKVAGVVGASSNNASGVTSVAWNAKLMPMRISDTSGIASWSAIASALTWAADHGARVANISYMVQSSSTVQSAAQYMKNKGGIVMNSAGNSGAYDATAPSGALVSVSATDSADAKASWSTWGPFVDLSAPGVGIWTTTAGGGYAAVSGTSFSSPLTAGVAALMIAANPSLEPNQIASMLGSSAIDLGTSGYDEYYGYGRINAANAVQAAALTRSSDTQPPTVSITAPTGGMVSGIIPVNANATDNVGVSRVDLLVNGTLIASDATAPYSFSWDSTKYADGSAALTARGYDAAGNVADSAPVSVTIGNATSATTPDTSPPAVSITNPGNGAKVTGNVTIRANAVDNVGIARLDIYVDSALKATGNSTSASYRWNTNKAAKGTHTISSVARDLSGNQATTSILVSK